PVAVAVVVIRRLLRLVDDRRRCTVFGGAETRSLRLRPPNGELADGARRHWADELLDFGARLVRLDGPHNLGGPDDDQPCSGDDREDHDRADRPGDYHPPSRLSL